MPTNFARFGGKRLMQGRRVVWDFGFRRIPDERKSEFRRITDVAQHLAGSWDGKTSISLFEAMKQVDKGKYGGVGQFMPAQNQPRGTCFPAGTLVLMADGTEKPIEILAPGDQVMTHLNRPRKVMAVGRRIYNGPLYSVTVQSSHVPIRMTEEHPVAVFPNVQAKGEHGFIAGKMQWVEAGHLNRSDRVLLPFGPDLCSEHRYDMADYVGRIANVQTVGAQLGDDYVRTFQGKTKVRRHVTLDARLSRLIGLFLAEGSTETGDGRSGSKLVMTFGGDEELLAEEAAELLRSVFGVKAKTIHPRPTVRRVICHSAVVVSFFRKECGESAYTKRVPDALYTAPRLTRLACIRGWLDGDGHIRLRRSEGAIADQTQFTIQGVTASAELSRGMCRLAMSCGIKPASYQRRRASHQRVASGDVCFYGQDGLALYPEWEERAKRHSTSKRGTQYVRSESGFLCKIKDVQSIHVVGMPVYNLEVEEDHSYVAGGIAVHNCVGRGGSGAANVLQCVQIAMGAPYTFKPVSHAAVYGYARELGGIRGSSDGAIGADAAKGLNLWGAVHQDEAGDTDYTSDTVAVKWGAGKGGVWVPQELKQLGADNLVKEVAIVTSAAQAADLIANGKPITIASDRGFTMTRDKDGFCKASGQWMHQMFLGAVVVVNGRKGFGIAQSWGDNTPSGPLLAGCPDYVFGGEWNVVDGMLRQGDSMGMSGAVGWAAEPVPVDWMW